MENTTNLKKKKPFFLTMARFFFVIYLITLYTFVDKAETVGISRLVFVMYAGFSVLVLLQRKRFYLGKNMLIVYTAVTWMYATIFWATNSFYASFTMGTIWQVFLLFFLTYNVFSEEEDAHDYLIKSLYIAGISLLIYSVYSYGISYIVKMMTLSTSVRIGKEISQANTFGMLNALTTMIAFYYLMKSKGHKLFHIAIMASAFMFVLSSGSRKALLMTCIGILFMVYRRYGIRKLYKVLAIVAVLAFVFFMVMQLPMFKLVGHRLEQMIEIISGESDGDLSSRVRFNMITDGWQIFKERLLIGYGANNFAVVSGYGVYSHNNFIEILVDFGLIGFILYYSIYITAMKELLTTKTESAKVLLSIFLVRFLMEVGMVTYYNKLHWILMAFFLLNYKNEQRPEEIEEEPCEEIVEISDEPEEIYEETEEFYEEDFSKTEEIAEKPEACADCFAE